MTTPTKLLMLGSGEVGRRCAALLGDAPGLEVTTDEPGAALTDLDQVLGDHQLVALVTERPSPAVAKILDERCWSGNIPWIQAELCGHQFRVGPTVVPPTTPCWECLQRRLRSLVVDQPAHQATQAAAESEPSEPWFAGQLGALTEQVAALTAIQCINMSSGRYAPRADGMGQYWEGDAVFGILRQRRFARIGLCPRCAPQDPRASFERAARWFGQRFVAKELASRTEPVDEWRPQAGEKPRPS
ncbi:TOMM precursor leader peptide-binding protein [Enhygromyxa salina]|uniref:Uncharacterized protein n=1 Tax=Enhygromyxa salina TaxID=215803 RepID=A0A2S9YTD5_9BACT|nr:TOMM precursor leader peptide-binding protein [Enhygromyxa salina]PRQ08299.1 hypothetical protein ENSA7_19220 [Enhygromyxa salina]